MKHLKILDFVIFFVILGFAFIQTENHSKKSIGKYATIQSPQGSFQYSLAKDQIINVLGPLGISTIEIKDGKIKFIDSPCQEKTCIHQNYGTRIICLPNKIVINIEETGEFDAITQ